MIKASRSPPVVLDGERNVFIVWTQRDRTSSNSSSPRCCVLCRSFQRGASDKVFFGYREIPGEGRGNLEELVRGRGDAAQHLLLLLHGHLPRQVKVHHEMLCCVEGFRTVAHGSVCCCTGLHVPSDLGGANRLRSKSIGCGVARECRAACSIPGLDSGHGMGMTSIGPKSFLSVSCHRSIPAARPGHGDQVMVYTCVAHGWNRTE